MKDHGIFHKSFFFFFYCLKDNSTVALQLFYKAVILFL